MLVIRQSITNTNIHHFTLIDYVKIKVLNADIKHLLNSNLEFKTVVSEKTGELSSKKVAEYHFSKIIIYEDANLIFFQGSIHKMYNSLIGIKAPNYNKATYKGFNGNTFTLNHINETINHLTKLFNCSMDNFKIQNVEFGINLITDFYPLLFIKGLLYHYGKQFEFRFNGNYAQVEHQRYILKIYCKSNQYKMKGNVLRIEIKIIKTEDLKSININTLADINENTLKKATSLLLTQFNKTVYYDYTIRKKGLNKRSLDKLKNYSNPRYWLIDLKSKERDRHKQNLENYISKYSKNLKQNIANKIDQKCSLINRLSETPFCSLINSSNIGLIMLQSTTQKPTQNNTKKKSAKKVKFCVVTGQDISMQKESSFLLSINQITNLYYTDKMSFAKVKNKYLSKKWIDADLEIQIKEIYHNIRNKASNQRIKQNRLYTENQIQMFN